MVAVEYYNQHHDPFIHHRHGIVNWNLIELLYQDHSGLIRKTIRFIRLSFIKTYSLNMLIVCHIELFLIISSHLLVYSVYQYIMFRLANLLNKIIYIQLICLYSSMLCTLPFNNVQ